MKCLICSFNNPATVSFCKKCGGKMDLSADEIQSALVEAQKLEKKDTGEKNVRNYLFLAIVLFLASLTFWIFSGGGPEKTRHVPSASRDSSYTKIKPTMQMKPRVKGAPVFPPPVRM